MASISSQLQIARQRELAEPHLCHVLSQACSGGKVRVVDLHRHIVAASGVGEHQGVDVDAGALGLGQRCCREGWSERRASGGAMQGSVQGKECGAAAGSSGPHPLRSRPVCPLRSRPV